LGVSSFILIIFYQNWRSTKGGLLTLLTNRLGDGLLILTLVVSLLNGYVLFSSFLVLLILIFLAFTKRAQWPFLSWLPAAMAAPTPVRALVHRSTLVTAGIWLMLRFSLDSVVSSMV
jgi:NADH-ubiquinone oxidoreductase chain 5